MKNRNFLKMFVLASLIMPAFFAQAQSKTDKEVLMTIGDQSITVKDFTDVYYKNNLKSDVIEKKSVDDYLELFTTFRMKVMEAERLQLDTSAKFKKELAGYRKQLAKPFMSSDDITDELIEEAYQRKLKDIRASHILIRCDKNALPSDTLKAYNKAMDIRKKALAKGADFGALADQYSDDPSAKGMKATDQNPARPGNHGDLGYFTVFDMVYPFETGAYNTKEGEISMPVRSDFGYHLIKVVSITDALGSVQAAHIFLQLPFDAPAEDVAATKQKADNIYKELMAQNETGGKTFKMKNDPRIYPFGHVLRKFSLDELPQLINILKGEMSIVGPRPPIPSEVAEYEPWHRMRLSVTPGLTCIWQVSGRSNIPFEDQMRLDNDYIRRDGKLGDDFKLILKTFKVVFTGDGAY